MIIQNIPFFSNTPDDTHCFQAVLKMVLKYFQPDRDYSFEELDKFSDKVPNMWTWATRTLINMQKMGFDLINMESFDYLAFSKNGKNYIENKFGQEMAIAQEQNSNLQKEMIDASEFVKVFGNNFILPEIEDIKNYIDQGYVIGCNVNIEKLNKNSGYAGHFILVFGYDDNNLYLHDPGHPPYPDRKVSFNEFTHAWAYPNHDNQNLVAFKLR